jgi:hypothetical protein
MIPEFYELYLHNAVVLLVASWALVLFLKSGRMGAGISKGMPAHEWVALAVIAGMPLFAVASSMYSTHVFVGRYTVWALIGVVVLLTGTVCGLADGSKVFGRALLAVLALAMFVREARQLYSVPFPRAEELVSAAVKMLPDSTEPIVMGDEHVYMELAYYAPERIRNRLIFAADPEMALRYLHADTGALLMTALGHWSKLQIVPLDEAVSSHKHFIVEATEKDYLLPYSQAAKYHVTPIAFSGTLPILFEVDNQNGSK